MYLLLSLVNWVAGIHKFYFRIESHSWEKRENTQMVLSFWCYYLRPCSQARKTGGEHASCGASNERPRPESLGLRGWSLQPHLERRSWNLSSPFWRNWLLTCAPFSLLRLTRPLITETSRSRLHSSTCSQCKHRRTLHFMAVF